MEAARAVLYGRVSKDRSQGRSVDEQLTECRAWAERERWAITAEHRDDGVSASRYGNGKTHRGWQATMDMITAGKVDLLVVWEISRATRDRAVWSALFAACIERNVKIATGGRVHDPSDPDDGFMMDLQAALAVRESAVTSKRIRRTIRATATSGLPHGKIPFGYRRTYDPETRRLVRQEPDPATAEVVREVAARLRAGEALYSVAADLNKRGIPTPRADELARLGRPVPPGLLWDPTQIKRLATNPTYAGLRTLHGAVVGPAAWPGLLSEADHHELVEKLTNPARKTWRDGAVKHLLSGLCECAVCGAPCRRVKNRNTPSYACSERFCVVRSQRDLDELVSELVVARLSTPDAWSLFPRSGEDTNTDQAAETVRALRARLDGFYTQAAAGEITPAGLARVEQRLLPQIADAERRARPRRLPAVVVDLAEAPDAAATWEQLSVPQRREVVRTLLLVRILPTGRGTQRFDPERIQIVWRRD
ncbi:MAG: recombinase family protein [Actinomycetota bacterium]|nr:recombinase family protein [Actinomycetota bacterium]